MSHHYTKNTVEAMEFCPTCNKNTMHYVWDGRLGRCKEDHAIVARQENLQFVPKEPEQGEMFPR